MAQGPRLSPDDWAQAALDALEEGGIAAVAVEPLAKRLGATKGSFYWHFANRGALVEAALARWEQLSTDEVIATAESEPDPAKRLLLLLTEVMEYAATGRIELVLQSSADDPAVARMLQRVAERRIGYVATVMQELGMPASEARRRSIIGVSIYHGFNLLGHSAPQALPNTADQRRALAESALTGLLRPW